MLSETFAERSSVPAARQVGHPGEAPGLHAGGAMAAAQPTPVRVRPIRGAASERCRSREVGGPGARTPIRQGGGTGPPYLTPGAKRNCIGQLHGKAVALGVPAAPTYHRRYPGDAVHRRREDLTPYAVGRSPPTSRKAVARGMCSEACQPLNDWLGQVSPTRRPATPRTRTRPGPRGGCRSPRWPCRRRSCPAGPPNSTSATAGAGCTSLIRRLSRLRMWCSPCTNAEAARKMRSPVGSLPSRSSSIADEGHGAAVGAGRCGPGRGCRPPSPRAGWRESRPMRRASRSKRVHDRAVVNDQCVVAAEFPVAGDVFQLAQALEAQVRPPAQALHRRDRRFEEPHRTRR